MVCLVAGCVRSETTEVDASVAVEDRPPPGYQGVCIQSSTDCREVEQLRELKLVTFACGETQPDPDGYVCFTPRNWFDERCCLETH